MLHIDGYYTIGSYSSASTVNKQLQKIVPIKNKSLKDNDYYIINHEEALKLIENN